MCVDGDGRVGGLEECEAQLVVRARCVLLMEMAEWADRQSAKIIIVLNRLGRELGESGLLFRQGWRFIATLISCVVQFPWYAHQYAIFCCKCAL